MASGTGRREFILTSAAASALATLTAKSYARVVGANERIQIGMIGLSQYVLGELHFFFRLREKDLDCRVTAVCDVYKPHLDDAVTRLSAKRYEDYRRLLDDRDVHAVVIATPDHSHSMIARDAALAGKDIYLESPMTRTWEEAVDLRKVVQQNKVVFQCGAQLCSDNRYAQAKQILDNKGIGTLLYAQASFNRNSRVGFFNRRLIPEASPANLDWPAWQKPVTPRPFDVERFVRWRKYWDYSGGPTTNLLFHSLAPLLVSLGVAIPKRVSAGGGQYLDQSADVPDTYFASIDYGSFSIQLTSCLGNELAGPSVIFGHEGSIRFENPPTVVRERYFMNEYKQHEEAGHYNVVSDSPNDHVKNWLESLRTRSKPICHEELAEAAMIAVHLGELSYRQDKVIQFDAEKRSILV